MQVAPALPDQLNCVAADLITIDGKLKDFVRFAVLGLGAKEVRLAIPHISRGVFDAVAPEGDLGIKGLAPVDIEGHDGRTRGGLGQFHEVAFRTQGCLDPQGRNPLGVGIDALNPRPDGDWGIGWLGIDVLSGLGRRVAGLGGGLVFIHDQHATEDARQNEPVLVAEQQLHQADGPWGR